MLKILLDPIKQNKINKSLQLCFRFRISSSYDFYLPMQSKQNLNFQLTLHTTCRNSICLCFNLSKQNYEICLKCTLYKHFIYQIFYCLHVYENIEDVVNIKVVVSAVLTESVIKFLRSW